MAESPITKVDVNTGSMESLVAIPGIGEALAARIIASRPYASLDDLIRVQGVSARSLERWAPMLAVEADDDNLPVLEAEFIDEEEEVIESGDEPVVEIEAVEAIAFDEDAVDEVPPVIEMVDDDLIPEPIPEEVDDAEPVEAKKEARPEEKKKAGKSGDSKPLLRGDGFILGGVVGVLSVLLAVVLTLGILALVNGGLDYVSPGQLSDMQRQVQTIEGQIGVLNQGIDGLSTRLDSLEALGGRVADLESKTDSAAKEVADLKAELSDLEETVGEMEKQVEVLSKQYGIVESFLGGMQDLLNNLMPENAVPAGE